MRQRLVRRARRGRYRVRRLFQRIPAWALLLILLPGVIVAGLGGGHRALGLGADNSIIVGNAAGTLSSVIRIDGALIVFGAGDSRSDLPDLVGRSTYPWNDRVHLLLVPGWDERHVVGALGLVERGNVEAMMILGSPGAGRSWTSLERAAEREGTEVRFLTGTHRIPVSDKVVLTLAVPEYRGSQPTAAVALLVAEQTHILMLDGAALALDEMSGAGLIPNRAHVLVTSRPAKDLRMEADVIIRPRAQNARDITITPARYESELQRGSRIRLRVDSDEIRIPLDRLTRIDTTD